MKRTLFIALVLLLAACGPQRNEDKMIFRYNESAGITTLDPAFAKDQSLIWACRQLYNGLVQLDTLLQVQPCIAKSWEISADGREYRFTLRDDVWFHKDGLLGTDSTRRVVAEDFVYSLRRLTDPAVASPGTWIVRDVKSFEAPDDTTFVIRLKEPFAPFLSQLGMVYCSVVPKEVVEHWGKDFRSHPCGTGPFQFQYWKEGVKLVLRKNPLYFERDDDGSPLPYLDAVAVTFIIDKQTAFLEFMKGKLDFMNSLDASYKDEILNADGTLKEKYADRIDMVSTPFLNTEYLGFNMETSRLQDFETSRDGDFKKLRQAVSCGFDRRKMMRYLRNNIGAPGTGGFIPKGLPGHSECGYEYDPERARMLLAEVKKGNGGELPKLKLSTTANYLDLCKYIQQQLGLLGLEIEVDVNPPAALSEQVAQGKTAWFRKSWVADYPDAENYLMLFYSPNRTPAGPNYTMYSNKKVDRLYERIRKESDADRRVQLCMEMDSLIMQDAPVIVLYYDQILHFTHHNVTGLRSDAMNTLDLRRVKKNLHD